MTKEILAQVNDNELEQAIIDNDLNEIAGNGSPSADATPIILPAWFVKVCCPSRMIWLAPLLGFILTLPSIFSGYYMDDHVLRQNGNEKSVYFQREAWDYFNLTSSAEENAAYRERGIFAWWAPDDLRIHFFRPLSSLVHAVQLNLFGNAPWLLHLCLALLYALLIFLCGRFLTIFTTSSIALGTGMLLFAINDVNAYSSGWISAYNTILSCIFGMSAFILYTRWRREKSNGALFLAVAAFITSLLSSEGGLALMGYLLAYELIINNSSLKNKTAALLPFILISLGYLLFYTTQHFGTRCSGIYLSPADNPAGTAYAILSNTIMLTVSQIVSFPPFIMIITQSGTVGVIVSLLLITGIIFLFGKNIFSNKKLAFFGTGMMLSIIPFTPLAAPMDRLLLWSGFGAAGFLGELCAMGTASTGKIKKFFTGLLLFNNTVFSLLFFVPALFLMSGFDKPAQAIEKQVPTGNTILLNAPFDILLMFPATFRSASEEWPQHFYFLYAGADTITIKRIENRTLLATTNKGWFATNQERMTRPKHLPFKYGDTVDLQLMRARVEKVTDDGRPLSVSFTFKDDITRFTWLKWAGKEPQHCELPPVGEEMKLFASLF